MTVIYLVNVDSTYISAAVHVYQVSVVICDSLLPAECGFCDSCSIDSIFLPPLGNCGNECYLNELIHILYGGSKNRNMKKILTCEYRGSAMQIKAWCLSKN